MTERVCLAHQAAVALVQLSLDALNGEVELDFGVRLFFDLQDLLSHRDLGRRDLASLIRRRRSLSSHTLCNQPAICHTIVHSRSNTEY